MKDELREFESDATSRKTATDWLMKVISGKKPINLHLNGSDSHEAEEAEGAVAVEELPGAPEPVPSKRAGWAEAKRETAAAEFTAEDLCGAPAVPVIRAFPTARDEITADDVCWVPVEQRLKPEPAAPKLKIVQPQERELPAAEMREPKRAEPVVTTEDISRDPAPFVVEPIWNGFAAEPDAPDAEQEITAEDIARDWVLNEMSPPPRETRDGAVLPFSFKVIQTTGTGSGAAEHAEAGMPEAEESTAAGLVEAGDAATVGMAPKLISAEAPEEAASAAEPRLDASAPIEIATEIVAEMPETMAAEPAAEIPVIEPDTHAVGHVAAMPVEAASEPVEMPVDSASEMAAVEEVTAAAEPDVETLASNEALEESAAEAEIETVLHEAEIREEEGAEPGSAAESVFARESFWEEAGASGAARGEEVYEKPVLQKVKWPQSFSEEMAETGQRPEGWVSAWKTLLRLGSVLPWVARALPMIEAGGLAEPGAPGSVGGLQEIRQDVSGLRLVQYEIRTTVQDHSMQLKRMEEQLGRVRESVESKASESGDLAESVRSMTRLVRLASMGLGGLLLVMVVLMIVMLAHGR